MHTITANDLKTRGVNILETELTRQPEVVVSVRGKDRFVVMEIEHYNYLRECELEVALMQTKKDIAEGKVVKESVTKHIKRISKNLRK